MNIKYKILNKNINYQFFKYKKNKKKMWWVCRRIDVKKWMGGRERRGEETNLKISLSEDTKYKCHITHISENLY